MMTTINPLANVTDEGDQSVKELVWAIEASLGEFSLTLAHCNYSQLRQQIIERLQNLCSVQIHIVSLPPTVTTLYTTIQEALQAKTPSALMVLGLESVADLPRVLASANKVREEFRKNFPFPIVIWVNDRVLEQLIEWAPDFKSWATTTEFVASTDALLQGMQQETDTLFDRLLDPHTHDLLPNIEVHRWEAHAALQDLYHRGQVLEPTLKASMDFILGREAEAEAGRAFEATQEMAANRHMETARQYYQQSLEYWQQVNHLERQGILLYHLGQNYCRQAEYYESKRSLHDPYHCQKLDFCYEQAKYYLHQCLTVFSQAHKPNLVAEFIPQLGEVLERQENWPALQQLAEKSLVPHQTYRDFRKVAQDYTFLANVALHQSRWQDAYDYAQRVLDIARAKVKDDFRLYEIGLFLFAQAEQQLGQISEAIATLEEARKVGQQIGKTGVANPRLNLQVLEALHRLYQQQQCYLEAFRIKHAQYSIEQQYGLRAFIGPGRLKSQQQVHFTDLEPRQPATIAQQILASGRQQSVQELIHRIKEYRFKLTVLYGPSGVGKSSMIEAGLIPALKQETVRGLVIVPVLLRNYTHWVEELGTHLSEQLREAAIPCNAALDATPAILDQLKRNGQQHALTVLIFDQFEEFFFTCRDLAEHKQFADFFCQCLNLTDVKIILSLREDYLHRLLQYSHEIQRTSSQSEVLSNILSQDNLYYIGNLTPEDTKSLLYTLTQRSQAYQPELVEALVQDLATEIGEIRPIELQVVGFQLEEERITTLAQYVENGSQKMVQQRYLEAVVADCGAENRRAAELVLYLLTDENNIRPIKTQAQLESDLKTIAQDLLEEANKLNLVLQIFVEAGIVLLMHETPADRYQLVHDYLVTIIRHQEETRLPQLKLALEKEKNQRQHAEAERDQALQDLHVQNSQLKTLNHTLANQKTGLEKTRQNLVAAAIALVVLTAGVGVSALQIRRGEVALMAAHAEALLASNRELDALVESLRALKGSKGLMWIDPLFRLDTQGGIKQVLQEAAYSVREINRFEAHRGPVRGLSFSSDGQTIATASEDNTVQLWNVATQQSIPLKGHEGPVYSVSFSPSDRSSPNGLVVATASGDHTVKLWCQNCQWNCPYTLKGHQDAVYSVSFSPDGQILATGSADRTVRLWTQDGQFLRVLEGHQAPVRHVSFRSDGQMIATASEDQTVKLWSREGRLLRTLTGHQGTVYSASFSPDGRSIATASADGTVRFWNLSGQQTSEFTAHANGVLWVSYHPTARTIATAGADHQVKIWSLDGQLLQTLVGHEELIYQASFSPNGELLATASADTTVKLWQPSPHLWEQNSRITALSFSPVEPHIVTAAENNTVLLWNQNGQYLRSLDNHQVLVHSIRYSPNGQTIATVGEDNIVNLWDRNGSYLRSVAGHQSRVSGISFSPDNRLLATASDDGSVKLWDQQGTLLKTLPHDKPVLFVNFSPEGQDLITISQDYTIQRWNREGTRSQTISGQVLRALVDQDIDFVRVSPDGEILAIVDRVNHTVKLWRTRMLWQISASPKLTTLQHYKPFAELEHRKPLADLSFSPNSHLVVTAGKDKVIRLWQIPDENVGQSEDTRSTAKATFIWHDEGFVEHVTFSPQSNLIALSSTSGRIILWDWQQGVDELQQMSCSRIQNYLQQEQVVGISDRALCDFE